MILFATKYAVYKTNLDQWYDWKTDNVWTLFQENGKSTVLFPALAGIEPHNTHLLSNGPVKDSKQLC